MNTAYIPQAGDVGTLATGTFSSFWIQLGERSRADHVVVADGHGGCYEATPRKGVCHSPLSRYDGKPIAWDKHREKTLEQRIKAIMVCEGYLGTRYFWRAIVVTGLHLLGLDLPAWARGNMSEQQGVICSEFGAIVLREMGFEFLGEEPAWRITPADHEEVTLFL